MADANWMEKISRAKEAEDELPVSALPRVLGIEDDPAQQLILDRVAQWIHPQLSIEWAFTAEEARARLEDEEFDLVIADVLLGRGESGMELWENEKLRERDTPFLFITSLGFDSFLKNVGPREICPPFLNKPTFVGETAQVIKNILGIKKGVSYVKTKKRRTR